MRCASGHSFDRAREGYLNLLPGGRSVARHEGDSRAMVAARQRFLEAGHYDLLADRLRERAAAALERAGDLALLDAGGGTGFYLDRLDTGLPGIVSDLSRDAARLGARRYPRLCHVVADTRGALPLATGSAALVLDVFAPRNPAEFARVLAPAGVLLVVVPTDGHLAELRDHPAMLGVQPDKRDRLLDALRPHLGLVDEQRIEAVLRLDGPALADLAGMGPGARRAGEQVLHELAQSPPIEVTLSVTLLAFAPRLER